MWMIAGLSSGWVIRQVVGSRSVESGAWNPAGGSASLQPIAVYVPYRSPRSVDLRSSKAEHFARGAERATCYAARVSAAKTNAARILEQQGIAYRLREYAIAEDQHLDAVEVAQRVGLPPESVFKTLVARGDLHGPCMAVLPGSSTLDLKALARASGDRAVALLALKEVTPLTGYVRGGVTALGAKKALPVYLDETALLFDEIAVSAGRKGLQILVAPADYIRATHARVAALGSQPSSVP
jgi:Cys-tRNA(Pro)/Cys-tRNA(Cys) deacylase